MKVYLIPGMLGLLAGLLLHWSGFDHPRRFQAALGLRRSLPVRSGFSALGYAIAGSAVLIWLAVIDTDNLLAIPADWYTALGGVLFGISAALCGFTPSTAFAGLAAAPLEALCTLAGIALCTLFLPEGMAQAASAPDLPSLACAGLLLAVIALCIPNPKAIVLPEHAVPLSEPAAAPDPASAPEETFVAILEGEEPLVVDTAEPAGTPEALSEPEKANASDEPPSD